MKQTMVSTDDTLLPGGESRAAPGGSSTLIERAYWQIKEAILTHQLRPSERISEGRLTAQYGLGKAAIRIALARLAQEQLVIFRSARTQVVAPLTWAGIREIFHLRVLLEPDAAMQAAGRVDVNQLNELNRRCQERYTPGDAREELRFLLANQDFHLAIARSSGNERQARIIEQLHDSVARILWMALKIERRPEVWSHGHDEIIAALAAGNGQEAAAQAKRHLMEGQNVVMNVILSSPELRAEIT